jgi:hypothetical protein
MIEDPSQSATHNIPSASIVIPSGKLLSLFYEDVTTIMVVHIVLLIAVIYH